MELLVKTVIRFYSDRGWNTLAVVIASDGRLLQRPRSRSCTELSGQKPCVEHEESPIINDDISKSRLCDGDNLGTGSSCEHWPPPSSDERTILMRAIPKAVAAVLMVAALAVLPATTASAASAGVVSPYCQSSNVGSTSFDQNLQCRLQEGPATRAGGYTGPINGIFGVNSWKGMQTFLKNNYGYDGPVNGIPGTNTYRAMQAWAKDRGGYSGPVNGIMGVNSWTGVDKAVEFDYYWPGVRL